MDARGYRVGDVIAGSYRVVRVFGGSGVSGMGVVYLVEERDAPQPFVLRSRARIRSAFVAHSFDNVGGSK